MYKYHICYNHYNIIYNYFIFNFNNCFRFINIISIDWSLVIGHYIFHISFFCTQSFENEYKLINILKFL